jgi:hypothetical protein
VREYFRKILQDQTPEELNFNFDLETLREAARFFEIRGRSKMNKIILCLNIEEYLLEESK